MVKKKEKTTFLKKNRHRIRIYSFILLYLQYQKIKENIYNLKSASNLNGNLNCSKELEHYSS